MNLTINDILLAQNIHRWTIVATKTDQSLAEHTFNVVMIARAIASEAEVPDANIIKYALDHDLDEIFTGDIPSPAKKRMDIKTEYNGKNWEYLSEVERIIVKMADLMDALLFIKYNHLDRHGKAVYERMRVTVDEYLEGMEKYYPHVHGAVENVIAMIEFGKYEVEITDGD